MVPALFEEDEKVPLLDAVRDEVQAAQSSAIGANGLKVRWLGSPASICWD